MKLVEILARELKEWPGGAVSITQDYDGDVGIYRISNPYLVSGDKSLHVWHHSGHVRNISPLSKVADDANSAIVTRKMWQAEREKLKPKKANADGWIRHRGGKCPVEDGAIVEVRLRDGKEWTGEEAEKGGFWVWRHTGDYGDIMAYRIHKPTEQPEPDSYVSVDEAMAYIDSYHTFVGDVPLKDAITVNIRDQHQENPLAWRDRIREIDRTVESLEEERVSLIQRLEDEGLQLLQGKVCGSVRPVEDMSDPSNWRKGDLITFVLDRRDSSFTTGKQYVFEKLDGYGSASVLADDEGGANGWSVNYFKWNSRPSA